MVKLSHLDSRGRARMVDVGHKPVTTRRAVASALVVLQREALEAVWNGGLEKGDALSVARLAGIQGAKQTPALIPLCHPLPLDRIAVELRLLPEKSAIHIFTEARTRAATGVEMEALTGAAVAALALIDMVKGVDRSAHVAEVRLEIKEGGSSGKWVRDRYEDPFAHGEKSGQENRHARGGQPANHRPGKSRQDGTGAAHQKDDTGVIPQKQGQAVRQKEGHVARQNEGQAVRQKEGHAARQNEGQAVLQKEGHVARQNEGQAVRQKQGHTVPQKQGNAVRQKEGAAHQKERHVARQKEERKRGR